MISPTPIYSDALITLYQGDALEIMPRLQVRVDAIVTDPPYCSGGSTARERTGKTPAQKYVLGGTALERPDFGGDQRDQRSFGLWSERWMSIALRLAKPPCYLAAFIDRRNQPTLSDAIQVAGWRWTDTLVWDKTEGSRPSKGWFRSSQAEFVVIGLLGSLGREQDRDGPCLPGVKRLSRKAEEKAHHMHAKPVELMRWLLGPLKAGSLALDPFMGAGSTMLAAREMGIRAIGIEAEAENCERTIARLRGSLAL